jgi:ankyrin repeat protein
VNQLRGGDLVIAARLSKWHTVDSLLDAGADPNAQDDRGETALIVASTYGPADVVERLLLKGADPNHASLASGRRPLDLAHSRYNDQDKRRIVNLLKHAIEQQRR